MRKMRRTIRSRLVTTYRERSKHALRTPVKLLEFDSYEEYRSAQIAANRLKFKSVFADDEELRRISEHFRTAVPCGANGLCHGVRNGYEVQMLRRLLPEMDIIGTDISETAATVPHCIVWDMHDLKPEWIGAIDFMYSNSWDHSFNPPLLFSRWAECLSPSGRLYLPYTELHSERGATEDTKFDVFGCSLDELIRILQRTLILEDVLEIHPRLTKKAWKRTLMYLRTGRFGKLIRGSLRSPRVVVLVLRKHTPETLRPTNHPSILNNE
jgi:hypothetical protein